MRSATLTAVGALLCALAPAVPALGSPSTGGRAADPPPAAAGARPGAGTVTVTLVTGDRAVVRTDAEGRRTVSLEDRAGHRSVATVHQDGDALYVIPEDALPLVLDGTVDRRLFDVNGLVEDGYDDAASDTVPVIVSYGSRALARQAAPDGTRRRLALPAVDGAALDVRKDRAATAWKELTGTGTATAKAANTRATRLWLDGRVEVPTGPAPTAGQRAEPGLPAPTVPLTGAPAAWRRGLTGKGVELAVLDTGYDAGHPDLVGRVTAAENFTTSPDTDDRHGHGTHVATTAAGSGAAGDGRYTGVAPGADLLVGKVLGDNGSGYDSWILAGMQWAVDQGADVVSMSLGDDRGTACEGPTVDAVQALSDRALFVVAAGNSARSGTVFAPGCAPEALTVGAADRDGSTAPFSSRGPAVGGHLAKPDIAAPGVDVVAARAGGRGERAYTTMSGTSMATPHVAGAAAILAGARPGLTPAQLRNTLMSAAGPTGSPVTEQGAGPLDVARAVDQQVTAPGTSSLGTYAWPHTGQPSTTTDVTLTNAGDRARTYRLDLDLLGDDGSRAPHGTAVLGARRVTVPAHATATVPVTVDPDPRPTPSDAAHGLFTGRIVATEQGGGHRDRVTAPVSLWLEPETVTLTVRALDRFGTPTSSPSHLDVVSLDRDTTTKYVLGASDVTLRLPAGSYSLAAFVTTRDTADDDGLVASVSFHARPRLVLDRDTTVTFDARRARRMDVRTDRPSEVRGYTTGYTRRWDGARMGISSFLNVPDFVHDLYVEDSPAAEPGGFTHFTQARAYPPRAALTAAGQRVGYEPANLRAEFDGTGSADLVDAGPAADLATADVRGKVAVVSSRPQYPNDYIARDARKAGAVGVVIGYPDYPGRWDWPTSTPGMPMVQLETADFAALRDRLAAGAPATLTWRGTALASSPYVYNLSRTQDDRVRATDLVAHDRDLAASRTTWYGQPDGAMRTDAVFAASVGMSTAVQTGTDRHPVAAPLTRTEYFTAGDTVRWTRRGSSDQFHTEYLYDGPRSYPRGGHSTTDWYRGVLRPVAPDPDNGLGEVAVRDGSHLAFAIPSWGDAAGHDGVSGTRDAKAALLTVDGQQVRPVGSRYRVPEGHSTVTYTQQVTRYLAYYPGWTGSAGGDTTWTFPTSSADQGSLPLYFPDYTADLDLGNTAPAVDDFALTVAAADQSGTRARLTDVRVEYAVGQQETAAQLTDWETAEVGRAGRDGTTWTAHLDQAAASGAYVSLRVSATTADGTTVRQTVVRAYPVR